MKKNVFKLQLTEFSNSLETSLSTGPQALLPLLVTLRRGKFSGWLSSESVHSLRAVNYPIRLTEQRFSPLFSVLYLQLNQSLFARDVLFSGPNELDDWGPFDCVHFPWWPRRSLTCVCEHYTALGRSHLKITENCRRWIDRNDYGSGIVQVFFRAGYRLLLPPLMAMLLHVCR